LRQQQTDAVPQVPSYRGFQATTHHNLGILLQNEKRYQEADATYRNGLAILEKLVADFPDEPDFRHRLAALQNSRGTLFGATGRAQQAEAVYRQALTVLEKLTDEFPADTGFRHKQAIGHLNLGNLLTLAGRPREAVKAYHKGRKIDPANAALCDALAWLLATCPDAKVNDASQAVELGKRAVELAPKAGAYWKTLGMAHLGVGDFKAVVQAFERSVDLRKGGDSIDWFYLAVAHAKLGDKDKASQYYRKGVLWMEEHRPKDEGMRRFRARVEQLLGLPEKKQQ